MSVAFVCDRCKKQFPKRESIHATKVCVDNRINPTDSLGQIDLCSTCVQDLKSFLTGEDLRRVAVIDAPQRCKGYVQNCEYLAENDPYSRGYCNRCRASIEEDRVNTPG